MEHGILTFSLAECKPERTYFLQGDACNLPALSDIGGEKFTVVHAANLLCRLPNPRLVFISIHYHVAIVVLSIVECHNFCTLQQVFGALAEYCGARRPRGAGIAVFLASTVHKTRSLAR